MKHIKGTAMQTRGAAAFIALGRAKQELTAALAECKRTRGRAGAARQAAQDRVQAAKASKQEAEVEFKASYEEHKLRFAAKEAAFNRARLALKEQERAEQAASADA